jgi:purine-binding chemotaxis protein CheW
MSAVTAQAAADKKTVVDQVYGVLMIGESQVALPLAGLREVIPCPPQLIVLPSPAIGLLGAVDLRGQVIPVLDLRVVLQVPAVRTSEQVIVVVIHDDRILGLLADEVRGVTTVCSDQLYAMTAVGDGELLFSHSFERPEDASVVSVLDVAAICRLPDTPVVRDSGRHQDDPNRAGREAGDTLGRSMLLMRCGAIGLGIEIEHVHATLPHLDVQASPLRHGVCLGVIDYGGVQVPVIDPLQLMAMGVLPADRVQGLVVRFEAGLIVLLLTEVIEIVQVHAHELLDLPPFTVRRPEFFRGVVEIGELGDFLVLDSSTLLGSEQLQILSTLNLANDENGASAAEQSDWAEPGRGSDDEGTGGGLYLTYSVAGEIASPLDQIVEILPYPKDFASLGDPDGLVMGLLTHRDGVVPLVCLATLLGRDDRPDPATACVLLVQAGSGTIGLVVTSLGAIEQSIWEEQVDPPPAEAFGDPVERAVADKRTIRTAPVGSVGAERMLARVDLVAIAEALAAGSWR